jgi:DNA-binding transcriptional ArsR family regulator
MKTLARSGSGESGPNESHTRRKRRQCRGGRIVVLQGIPGLAKIRLMARRSKPPPPAAGAAGWNPDVVFAVLADPVRRRLFQCLAHGKPLRALDLALNVGRRLDAALKHLVFLRKAGWITMAPDPVDARRQLYSLAPFVVVTRTEKGCEIDFGCCVLRI